MAPGKVIPHHDEAIVLRTWPFHEADLLVSLFTREQGKVKGVARHAMKSRRRFGGALEPATFVMAHYTERPHEELVRLDSFEILWSPMSRPVDLLRTAGLQLVVEVLEEVLPDLATDDNLFRLAATVLPAMSRPENGGGKIPSKGYENFGISTPATYFCLWVARLMGWMPELVRCSKCGIQLDDAWWSTVSDGVTCADDRRENSIHLTPVAIADIGRIFRSKLPELAEEGWTQHVPSTLDFGLGLLERNLNRRIRSGAALHASRVGR